MGRRRENEADARRREGADSGGGENRHADLTKLKCRARLAAEKHPLVPPPNSA
jgi:hypothetical protein